MDVQVERLLTALPAALLLALAATAQASQAAREEWFGLPMPGYAPVSAGGSQGAHPVLWCRCYVPVPSGWSGRDLVLALGEIDGADEAYFNGHPVGNSGTIEPLSEPGSGMHRRYAVPARHVLPGRANQIALRLRAAGGRPGVRSGLLRLESPAGALSLVGRWEARFAGVEDTAPPDREGAGRIAAFTRAAGPTFARAVDDAPLAGTAPLQARDDLASALVAAADRFLLRELEASISRRARHWQRDTSTPEAYNRSVEKNRRRLAQILGLRDPRVPFQAPELLGTTRHSSLVARAPGYEVHVARWPALEGVHGEGLLLLPTGRPPRADVVLVPDATQLPEHLAGLQSGASLQEAAACRLAAAGCRVLVPFIVDRTLEPRGGRAVLTTREYLYRPAFELGRHLLGYELQKVMGAVDWLAAERAERGDRRGIGVGGWGDGGLLGLYAAALDTRIDGALVSGYFGRRQQLWEEPIDRNVFGLLDQFGDAELAALVAPRGLVVEASKGPEVVLPGQGGAPARLVTPAFTEVRAEVARGEAMVAGLRPRQQWRVTGATDGQPAAPYSSATLNVWLEELGVVPDPALIGELPTPVGPVPDATSRRLRQVREIDQHTQRQLTESPYVRGEFMRDLDTFSLERYVASSEPYRARFAEDTIGRFDQPLLAPNARSRLAYDTPAFRGYEVTLEVFPDLFAYGILLLPRDLGPGERRPVVVCQHGLEGRPQDVISGEVPAYRDFAARLAERGFITFAPQNLYIFGDRFRTLQRKANPLGKSLFSLIVPQHQQIVNWLKSLPCVDPGRIAFYGLSYGGKTAMRVPALVTDYCLSICSADFNEWVWKNASTRSPYSYVFTGEYEIFEWDLGSTFNYAEMAALIAPRPFMVERGHFDGVAPDETVAYEFARVRHLYQARLGIGDRCEIEWFVGPHTINGQGTFDFLHRHLRWPVSRKQAGKR